MIECYLYERIVRGDMRPHLNKFSKSAGVKQLEAEFCTWRIDFDVTRTDDELISLFTDRIPDYQPGDLVRIRHDSGKKMLIISAVRNKKEGTLINTDIPPPGNKKSATFLRIIEDEFKRIKMSIRNVFKDTSDVKALSVYGVINIQFLKNLSRDIYILEKKLNNPGKNIFKDSDLYVVYILKKYLIYSIQEFQSAFQYITGIEKQRESELEDELFGEQHSRTQSKVEAMSKKFNQMQLQRIYKTLGENTDLDSKIKLLKEKLVELNNIIALRLEELHYYIPYEDKLKNLYEDELGKLLLDKYLTYVTTEENFKCRSEQLEKTLILTSSLKRDRTSLEFISLEKIGFFDIIEEEINIAKYLLAISESNQGPDLLSDLIAAALTIQTRKRLKLAEDDWNDFLTDLLRFKGYNIADQTRSGYSSNSGRSSDNSGELDIAVRNIENSGVIDTIIETLKIYSCGEENKEIKNHIDKLLKRYDLNGNEVNYIVVLSYATGFSEQWKQYKSYVSRQVFHDLNATEDFPHTRFEKSDLRVGLTAFVREERLVKLFHIFVNMHC